MGQAFFTLSLGISAMEVFGSRIGKQNSLTGEALRICGLDTAVSEGLASMVPKTPATPSGSRPSKVPVAIFAM